MTLEDKLHEERAFRRLQREELEAEIEKLMARVVPIDAWVIL